MRDGPSGVRFTAALPRQSRVSPKQSVAEKGDETETNPQPPHICTLAHLTNLHYRAGVCVSQFRWGASRSFVSARSLSFPSPTPPCFSSLKVKRAEPSSPVCRPSQRAPPKTCRAVKTRRILAPASYDVNKLGTINIHAVSERGHAAQSRPVGGWMEPAWRAKFPCRVPTLRRAGHDPHRQSGCYGSARADTKVRGQRVDTSTTNPPTSGCCVISWLFPMEP